MAAPVIESTDYSALSGTSNNIAFPSGTTTGDLVVIFYATDGTEANVNQPSGWTSFASEQTASQTAALFVWARVIDGSEGGSVTVTTTASEIGEYFAVRISGHDGISGIANSTPNINGSSGTTINYPAATTTVNDALVFGSVISSNGDNSASFPGGWTGIYNNDASPGGTGTGTCSLNVAEYVQSTAGATSTSTLTIASSTYLVSHSLAIQPPSSSSITGTANIDQADDSLSSDGTVTGGPVFPDDWGRRCAITVNDAVIDSTLTDFTAIVRTQDLPSEMFDVDGSYPALDGGGDIRFTSDSAGTTRLACDVRTFVTDNNPANGVADIAVKIPSVSSSADTTIYVWYNKTGVTQPGPSDTYGRNNAYDSDYLAVYSLDENPSASSPQFTDRTGNGYSGTTAGNPTNGTGVAGDDVVFDGTGDAISLPDLPSFSSDFALSCWAKTPETTGNYTVLSLNTAPFLEIWAGTFGSDSSFSWKAYSGAFVSGVHMQSGVAADNNYTHLGLRRSSGTNALFVNGASTATYSNSETFTNPAPYIGARPGAPPSIFWDGAIDEVRISSDTRADAWIKAEYENLRTSSNVFWSVGTPVTPGAGGITGSASIQQADNTLSSSADVAITATLSATQANNTLASAGDVFIEGQASILQDNNTLSSTASSGITGQSNITQEGDSLTSDAAVSVTGTCTVTQEDNTLSSSAAVGIEAAANITQADNTLSSTGVSGDANIGSVVYTQGDQTVTAYAEVSGQDELGGGGLADYHKYRKYLETLVEATREKKVTKEIKVAAKSVSEIPVKTPQINKIAAQKIVAIDYEKINNEIALIYEYLNKKIDMYEAELAIEAEKEDELALLLVI